MRKSDSVPVAVEDRTLELFAQWECEDTNRLAKMIPEEIAAEDARDAELIRFLETSRISLHRKE